MSNKNYKDGKRAYSSSDNSFDAKLMRLVYQKEYLDKLENNSENAQKINNTVHSKNSNVSSIAKKILITLFILILFIGISRWDILHALFKKSSRIL